MYSTISKNDDNGSIEMVNAAVPIHAIHWWFVLEVLFTSGTHIEIYKQLLFIGKAKTRLQISRLPL